MCCCSSWSCQPIFHNSKPFFALPAPAFPTQQLFALCTCSPNLEMSMSKKELKILVIPNGHRLVEPKGGVLNNGEYGNVPSLLQCVFAQWHLVSDSTAAISSAKQKQTINKQIRMANWKCMINQKQLKKTLPPPPVRAQQTFDFGSNLFGQENTHHQHHHPSRRKGQPTTGEGPFWSYFCAFLFWPSP